jgi:hypothetical protein
LAPVRFRSSIEKEKIMNTNTNHPAALFPLGQVVATPGALELLDQAAVNAAELLQRHVSGDWGIVPEDDAELNQSSVSDGNRILSSYPVGDDRIWIITEADRSSTTLLLPSEY